MSAVESGANVHLFSDEDSSKLEAARQHPVYLVREYALVAVIEPANDEANECFSSLETEIRSRLGLRMGFPKLGDSDGSQVRDVLATEDRTALGRAISQHLKTEESPNLLVPRQQSARLRAIVRESGGEVTCQTRVVRSPQRSADDASPVVDFVAQFETGTIELNDIASLGVPLVLALALAYPNAVIGVITLSRVQARTTARTFQSELRHSQSTHGVSQRTCETCEELADRVQFIAPGRLHDATLVGDEPGQFSPLLANIDVLLLMPGQVLLHEQMLNDLIGAATESWHRTFAVVDPTQRFQPGADEQIAAAWLGHARIRCRKGLRYADRPVRHTPVNFRGGVKKSGRVGLNLGQIRSATASFVARNNFLVDWSEALLAHGCHEPLQRSINAWLQDCTPNVAILVGNAAQVQQLKQLAKERHATDWLTPDEAQTDIFGVVRFEHRLIVQLGDLSGGGLRELIAGHIDVVIIADAGPGLPAKTRDLLDRSGSKPLLVVDIRDRKNAPRQLQRWNRQREQDYLRRGWLRLEENS